MLDWLKDHVEGEDNVKALQKNIDSLALEMEYTAFEELEDPLSDLTAVYETLRDQGKSVDFTDAVSASHTSTASIPVPQRSLMTDALDDAQGHVAQEPTSAALLLRIADQYWEEMCETAGKKGEKVCEGLKTDAQTEEPKKKQ